MRPSGSPESPSGAPIVNAKLDLTCSGMRARSPITPSHLSGHDCSLGWPDPVHGPAGARILPGRGLDFVDPWGNRVQVVEAANGQFG
jgi:hypothetical protein